MSALTGAERTPAEAGHSWVRTTWPVDRRQAITLAVALVAMIGVFAALGFVLTDLLAPNAVTRADEDVAQWFAEQRTPRLDDLAHWGAFLSDTMTKIVITAVFALSAVAVWRRWHEAVYVVTTLVFEATVFITVTAIVARPRPDVPRLEDSPVNSSFPSGHVAAATVYGAFVVVVFWHTTSRVWRVLAVVVVGAVVAAVSWARMYQGMHFASDVAAGILLGLVTLALCLRVLGAPEAPPSDERSALPSGVDADDRVGTRTGAP